MRQDEQRDDHSWAWWDDPTDEVSPPSRSWAAYRHALDAAIPFGLGFAVTAFLLWGASLEPARATILSLLIGFAIAAGMVVWTGTGTVED